MLETATHAPLPEAPLERAAALIARHRYPQGEARALLAIKAGAAKLLRQLETARFERYAPFVAIMR